MPQADIVILGGGSGGYACALRAAELGKSVILIDADKLGGTCLHRGCIPTKALLHAAEVADSARESDEFGVKATFEGIDMPQVNKYRDGVVGRLYKGLQGLIKSRGVTLVEGYGKMVGPTTVEVNGEQYTGENLVLATGSYAKSLPGLEIDGRIMTSDQALTLDYVPERVIVLGGGVIGVEFASVWKSFGSDVTIVEALPHLVPNEDEACSKALERAYKKRGINLSLGVRFAGATQNESGVQVSLEDGTTIDADLLLVAVGRGPSTDGMGYDEQGVAMDRGWVLAVRCSRSADDRSVRRRRRARACKRAAATAGRPSRRGMSCSLPRARTMASVSAVAVEVRSPGSNRLNSPNISPGPRTAISDSRPSGAPWPSFTFPSRIRYRCSPGSPSWNSSWPLETFISLSELRRASAPWASRAENRGVFAKTSSTTVPFGAEGGWPSPPMRSHCVLSRRSCTDRVHAPQ